MTVAEVVESVLIDGRWVGAFATSGQSCRGVKREGVRYAMTAMTRLKTVVF
ncbi:MAG: hypothetical protein ACM30G_05335 [Micromonosporaceae bacterium]